MRWVSFKLQLQLVERVTQLAVADVSRASAREVFIKRSGQEEGIWLDSMFIEVIPTVGSHCTPGHLLSAQKLMLMLVKGSPTSTPVERPLVDDSGNLIESVVPGTTHLKVEVRRWGKWVLLLVNVDHDVVPLDERNAANDTLVPFFRKELCLSWCGLW